MSTNAIMLAVRFLMELATVIIIGYWGWSQATGFPRFLLAFGLPIAAAAIWGTFAVPDDPTRSGKAPVPIHGIPRLILELLLFAIAVYMLVWLNQPVVGWLFGALVVVHYALSYDRVIWLVSR